MVVLVVFLVHVFPGDDEVGGYGYAKHEGKEDARSSGYGVPPSERVLFVVGVALGAIVVEQHFLFVLRLHGCGGRFELWKV